MSDIRGLIIQSRLDFIERLNDSKKTPDILQKLSDPVRQAIGEQIFLTNLYNFRVLKEFDITIGESLDSSLESIFRDIGSIAASKVLDCYFFNYMQNNDPHGFLAQIERLYAFLWYFGKYSYSKQDDNTAIVQLDYDEDIHKSYCWYVQSFLSRSVELCGGQSVVVSELECEAEDGESCKYEIRWK